MLSLLTILAIVMIKALKMTLNSLMMILMLEKRIGTESGLQR